MISRTRRSADTRVSGCGPRPHPRELGRHLRARIHHRGVAGQIEVEPLRAAARLLDARLGRPHDLVQGHPLFDEFFRPRRFHRQTVRQSSRRAAGAIPPPLADHSVMRDPEQPRGERSLSPLKPLNRSQHPHKNLFRQVLGIVRVARTSQYVPVNPGEVETVEFRKRRFITRAGNIYQQALTVRASVRAHGTILPFSPLLAARWLPPYDTLFSPSFGKTRLIEERLPVRGSCLQGHTTDTTYYIWAAEEGLLHLRLPHISTQEGPERV